MGQRDLRRLLVAGAMVSPGSPPPGTAPATAPGDDDWARWNGAQMRAAVEYLEGGRDAAPPAERP